MLELLLKDKECQWISELDPELQAKLMIQLGINWTVMEKYRQGLNQSEDARRFALEHQIPLQAARAQYQIATNLLHLCKRDESHNALLQAREEFKMIGTTAHQQE